MHLYTTGVTEVNAVIKNANYHLEAVACYLYDPATKSVPAGTTPLYRFYDPQSGTHYYTSNKYELPSLGAGGAWNAEGIAGYLYDPATKSVPAGTTYFYCLNNPTTHDWFYTADKVEGDNLLSSGSGYQQVGIVGYVYAVGLAYASGTTGTGTVPFYRLSNT
jgi:hypothetical protein